MKTYSAFAAGLMPAWRKKEKLRLVFRGRSHNIILTIAANPPKTVQAFLSACNRYDDPQSGESFQKPFERRREVTPTTLCVQFPSSIREQILNDFQRILSRLSMYLPNWVLKEVVKDEPRALLTFPQPPSAPSHLPPASF